MKEWEISEKIAAKLGRKLAKEVVIAEGNAFAIKEENDKIIKNIIGHNDIIWNVIEKYGYKGTTFKVEYLPVIMAMAIDEYKKHKNNTLKDICNICDIRHF